MAMLTLQDQLTVTLNFLVKDCLLDMSPVINPDLVSEAHQNKSTKEENIPMQYIASFHGCRKGIFQSKISDISLVYFLQAKIVGTH